MTEPKKNPFGSIIDATRARHAEEADVENTIETKAAPVREQRKPEPVIKQKRGGKSSDPAYRQVSAYILRQTHQKAHRKLLDENTERDLSDVIEELLSQWVKK